MANLNTTPADGESLSNVTGVRLGYSVGASGALTALTRTKGNPGIVSVTRNSAGSYTFVLSGTYPGGLLQFNATLIGAYTTAGGTVAQVTVDNSATSTKTITVVFYAVGTQTATEVDSGVELMFNFALKNGTV